MINRDTGKAQILPRGIMMIEGCRMADAFGNPKDAVAGIGDSFFLIQSLNIEGSILWQIKEGQPPKPLTKYGRRPVQSPFDAEDRRLGLIHSDKGRLLVASSWEHIAYYNPAQNRWENAPVRKNGAWRNYTRGIERRQFQASLFPQHLFRQKNGAHGYFSGPTHAKPGRLPFQYRNGPVRDLPVRIQVPATYKARFQVDSKDESYAKIAGKPNYEWISVADLARSNMVAPVILNQTDDFFILGMRLKPLTMHSDPSASTYLPFLWLLDKKEAFPAMQRLQKK